MRSVEHSGLSPGQRFKEPLIKVSSSVFHHHNVVTDISGVTLVADIMVFIDNGLPCEVRNYDLMADLRTLVGALDSEWLIRA